MKAVLIYDNGYAYEPDVQIQEFDSKESMIKFINDNNIGAGIMAAYEYYNEIKIEPFEKILTYRIKE